MTRLATFTDGPAYSTTMRLSKLPHFLRVAHYPSGLHALHWHADALTALGVWVYQMIGMPIYKNLEGGNCTGAVVEYALVIEQPEQRILQHANLWDGWCEQHAP
jgi:hypothetical protein